MTAQVICLREFRRHVGAVAASPVGGADARVIDLREHLSLHRVSQRELYILACKLDELPNSISKACELYQQAMRGPDPKWTALAAVNLGNIKFRGGDHEKAVILYSLSLSLYPGSPEAHYNLGYICQLRGEHHVAKLMFEQALRLDPEFSDAWFNLATSLQELGDYRGCASSLRSFLATTDTDCEYLALAEKKLSELEENR